MARSPVIPLAPGARHSRGGLAHGQRDNPYSPTAAQRRLTADRGSFVVTFSQVGSSPQFLPADTGYFSATASDSGLLYSRLFAADYGSFVLTGEAATLTYSGAITPTYTLTAAYGQFYAYGDLGPNVAATAGTFSVFGQDVTLTYRTSRSDTGTFTLSGQDATLTYVPSTGKQLKDENGSALLDLLGSALLDLS